MQHVGTRGSAKDIASQEQLTGLVASQIHAAAAKATPVDADELGLSDSAASWGLKKLTWANLKAALASVFFSKSGGDIAGNINLTGAGRRITGDFSDAVVANRTMFKSSVANGNSIVHALPNGTAQVASFRMHNSSDPDNASNGDIRVDSTQVGIFSSKQGSGAFLPLTSYVSDFKNTEQPITGGFLVTGGALGYGVGSGGTVTQPTNKNTAIAINKPSGFITMAQGSIPANGTAAFLVSNSTVANGDTVSICLIAGITTASTGYMVDAQAPQAGQFYIIVRNVTGTATPSTDQPTLQFNVHRGSRS